ncbi:MAG: biopolymer transporter ExbD [Pseudomonadota bacterium]|mgnify:CR=1 FL=1
MAFGQLDRDNSPQPLHEINVTPLVDVLLVLLVVFIIAAPLFSHKIKIALPKADAPKVAQPQKPLIVSLDVNNQIFLDQEMMTPERLQSRLTPLANANPQLAVELRAAGELRYQHVIRVIATIQKAGVTKLAFVTEPATKK